MKNLKAGAAAVNITPPIGISMCGFANRKEVSQSIHDDLHARVIVLANAQSRLVIITADVISFAPDLVTRIRQAITALTAIPGSHVLINGSHTHSGPTVMSFRSMGIRDVAYEDVLCRKVVGAVKMASDSLQPARISHGRAPCRIGYNRRENRSGRVVLGHHPEGPEAPWVDVLRIDDASGRTFALLYATASHPVNLHTLAISADFPGFASEFIAHNAPGVIPLFAQACCGDINCAPKDGTFEASQALGTRLGAAALTACLDAQAITDGTLQASTQIIPLAQMKPSVDAAEAALKAARADLDAAQNDLNVTPYLLQQRFKGQLAWAEDYLLAAQSVGAAPDQPFEIQTFRIGTLAIVSYPGEMFINYQLALDRDSPFDRTITLGYSNGCIGYVPTADAYPLGGYEIDQAFKYYGTLMITPDCEDHIKTRTLHLLQKHILDTQ
ncbi:MAG: neutral/alkaline non-lysosomal ceramidase N-terminal domain-containing protein [bacterium]|nr:neutral/alkaline non-lysosomal ceramidase N-terminal domain-containing protein [bacterium]